MAPSTPARRARRKPTVVVVGGGIAGLAAAWELTGGARGPDEATPHVCILEASPRLGGKLSTATFDGRAVDMGPDSMLGRRPEAAALCREVGLGDELVPVGASGASIWARGRLRPMPAGLALGIPTRFWPVARSGILGKRGSFRLFLDIVAPRPDTRTPLGDRAVGPLIARKLGHRVVQMLVDPMLGGITASSTADMSAAASFPLLLAVAQTRGGFMHALRRAIANGATVGTGLPPEPEPTESTEPAGSGSEDTAAPREAVARAPAADTPFFWALRGGMQSLVDALGTKLVERGVTVRTGTEVELLDQHVSAAGEPWALHTAEGPVVADGIVLALPAPPAGRLLEPHDTDAATLLRGIDHASVALVTLSFPADAVGATLRGTGFLVPPYTLAPPEVLARAGAGGPGNGSGSGSGNGSGNGKATGTANGTSNAESVGPDTIGDVMAADRHLMVTACTFLSVKWPHLAREGEVLLRASVGRYGDDRFAPLSDAALTARVVAELSVLLGLTGPPTTSSVTRWVDGLPQYRVHHLLRVTGIESAVKRLPAVAVAGAAYRGVGIPACIASGRAAAREVLAALAGAFPP